MAVFLGLIYIWFLLCMIELFWNFVHWLTKSSLRFLEGGLKRTMRESTEGQEGYFTSFSLTVNLYQMCEAMEVLIWSAPVYTLGLCLWQHANIPPTLYQFFLQDWSARKLEGVFVKIFLTPAPACEHVVDVQPAVSC